MPVINEWVSSLNSLVWGVPMLVLILGTGIYLTVILKFVPWRKIVEAFRQLFAKPVGRNGEISPFGALMTSLSATIGTGNIAGVATAIALGGPGALFWMWLTALFGMATKYAEAVLAIRFRETNEQGEHRGGPMYYIRNGLGQQWGWLATAFAVCGAIAGFGIGNTVQSNSVASGLAANYGISSWVTGMLMFVMVSLVLLGGVRRIAAVATGLVPFMALAYLSCGLWIIGTHLEAVPAALSLIINSAFTGHAATGGFAGAAMIAAIRFGVARGIFSNEAGLGSAPITHAHANTDQPVKQGLVAMLGTFIDTLLVCSVTGLVIVMMGSWTTGESSAALTSMAFDAALPSIGAHVVGVGLALFAFTTVLGWSIYGERCAGFLLGERAIIPFRLLWTLAVPLGAVADLEFIWLLADTLNALMALPNLVALLLLSPVVVSLTREYFSAQDTQS